MPSVSEVIVADVPDADRAANKPLETATGGDGRGATSGVRPGVDGCDADGAGAVGGGCRGGGGIDRGGGELGRSDGSELGRSDGGEHGGLLRGSEGDGGKIGGSGEGVAGKTCVIVGGVCGRGEGGKNGDGALGTGELSQGYIGMRGRGADISRGGASGGVDGVGGGQGGWRGGAAGGGGGLCTMTQPPSKVTQRLSSSPARCTLLAAPLHPLTSLHPASMSSASTEAAGSAWVWVAASCSW